jgi:hypothetical protein
LAVSGTTLVCEAVTIAIYPVAALGCHFRATFVNNVVTVIVDSVLTLVSRLGASVADHSAGPSTLGKCRSVLTNDPLEALVYHSGKDIRVALVERPGLGRVDEVSACLGNSVGVLVYEDILSHMSVTELEKVAVRVVAGVLPVVPHMNVDLYVFLIAVVGAAIEVIVVIVISLMGEEEGAVAVGVTTRVHVRIV